MSSTFQSTSRVLLCGALLFSSLASAQQPITVSSSTSQQIQASLDPRPEPEWDVTGIVLAGIGGNIIVRNDDANDPARQAELLDLAKNVYGQVVRDESGNPCTTQGAIGTYITGSTLAAVEFDFFDEQFDPDYDPTPEPSLGTEALAECAELVYDDGSGPVHLGYMYCYDESQADARLALLEAGSVTVWLGDLVHTANPLTTAVKVLGNDNVFDGNVRSGGGMKIGGFSQAFLGSTCWASGFLQLTATGTTFTSFPYLDAATPLRSTPQTLGWYQVQPNTLSFTGDVTVMEDAGGNLVVYDGAQNWPAEGQIVIVNGGGVDVEGTGLSGSISLIADGAISFSASSCLLRPAATDLLAWSRAGIGTDGITIGGSGNQLTGSLFAPNQIIRLSGSNNSITGQLSSDRFRVTGGFNVLSDGIHR